MAMFLAGVAAGVVLGAALGWRGLAVLAAVGIALLLATRCAKPDTKQAVNGVIEQLVRTGMFCEGKFRCPDSGLLTKGIALSQPWLATNP